jgi:outer membrane cobalamin receptor
VRRALVLGAVAAAGTASPAIAQENLGEIVVTGSRIRSANLESTTPVTQVTAADVVTQGVTRIEDLVNQLPQAFAAQNVTVSNGSTGTATLNLRGLGSPRTLVLVDGRRLPYGGVTNSAADINQIPKQMIERVDVLTGPPRARPIWTGSSPARWCARIATKSVLANTRLPVNSSCRMSPSA